MATVKTISIDENTLFEDAKKFVKEKEKEIKRNELVDEPAKQIFALYSAYVREGFTEEQAFELVKIAIAGAGKWN